MIETIRNMTYSHSDPCIDLYFSNDYREIVLGARCFSKESGVLTDCLTHRLSLWPVARDFGALLMQLLAAPSNGSPIDSERSWSLSSASSLNAFRSAFQPICVWTKKDIAIPYVIGAPISDRYPDSFNRRPIQKQLAAHEFGNEVIRFMQDLAIELAKSGQEEWKSSESGVSSG